MSNELNNNASLYTNGTYEGIAIGGDRYLGSTSTDHLLRYEEDPECKLLAPLGEVGGIEEYRVIEVKDGRIKRPTIPEPLVPAQRCSRPRFNSATLAHSSNSIWKLRMPRIVPCRDTRGPTSSAEDIRRAREQGGRAGMRIVPRTYSKKDISLRQPTLIQAPPSIMSNQVDRDGAHAGG